MLNPQILQEKLQLVNLEQQYDAAYAAMVEMGMLMSKILKRDDAEVVLNNFEFYMHDDDLFNEEHQALAKDFDAYYFEYREAMTVLLDNCPAMQRHVEALLALQKQNLPETITRMLARFEQSLPLAITPPATPTPSTPPRGMNADGTKRGLYFAPEGRQPPAADREKKPAAARTLFSQ